MKNTSKRYYGMTITQIGMLVGAAVVGLLIICVVFTFVLMQSSPQAQPPVATKIVSPTQTLAGPTLATTAPTPTQTPAPLIATSVPPDDWVEFETQGATLWLPGNFVGGDISGHKQETILKISELGRYFSNIVAQMKNAGPEISLWMVDKTVGKSSLFITTVSVHHYVETADKTIDQFMADDNSGDYNGTPWAMFITINGTKKMKLLGRETRRQTYQQHGVDLDYTGVAYYIKDGADFWIVDYITDPNQYVTMAPIIEQSILTFNLTK